MVDFATLVTEVDCAAPCLGMNAAGDRDRTDGSRFADPAVFKLSDEQVEFQLRDHENAIGDPLHHRIKRERCDYQPAILTA
jgi:hypothetical protein